MEIWQKWKRQESTVEEIRDFLMKSIQFDVGRGKCTCSDEGTRNYGKSKNVKGHIKNNIVSKIKREASITNSGELLGLMQ